MAYLTHRQLQLYALAEEKVQSLILTDFYHLPSVIIVEFCHPTC